MFLSDDNISNNLLYVAWQNMFNFLCIVQSATEMPSFSTCHNNLRCLWHANSKTCWMWHNLIIGNVWNWTNLVFCLVRYMTFIITFPLGQNRASDSGGMFWSPNRSCSTYCLTCRCISGTRLTPAAANSFIFDITRLSVGRQVVHSCTPVKTKPLLLLLKYLKPEIWDVLPCSNCECQSCCRSNSVRAFAKALRDVWN